MSPRANRGWRMAVAGAVALLAGVGCRNQTVSVKNDSADPVRLSVAQSWSGVLELPAHTSGELKARLRPGMVEVAIERGGMATALTCPYQASESHVFVRIPPSG